MSDNVDSADPAEGAADNNRQQPAVSRRSLLRGGVAAAPVLLTVVSRPVMATGTGNCTAASAFASINASRPDSLSVCSGKSPKWWATSSNAGYWPPKYPRATKFQDCLASYSNCNGKTLLQVVGLTATSGNDCVAKYIVAALLNAATNKTVGVLDEGTVKTIWAKFVSGGQYWYSPTAGIKWFADSSQPNDPRGGLTAWLQTTMG